MHFTEMSFAVNILNEELVTADFPSSFLFDVKSLLPGIQASLQVFLITILVKAVCILTQM